MDSINEWFKIKQVMFFLIKLFITTPIFLFLPILFCNTVSAGYIEGVAIAGDYAYGADAFEPDDDPNIILFNALHKIIPGAPRRHTFYCPNSIPGEECNDTDWVYFYAEEGNHYEICALDTSGYGYIILPRLYDSNIIPLNSSKFDCQRSGNYLIEVKLASGYPQDGVEYILSFCDTGLVPVTDIFGRIIDPNGIGINGMAVQLVGPDGLYKPPVNTVSILDDSNYPRGGYYYIPDITVSLNTLNLEVYDYNNPNSIPYTESLDLIPYTAQYKKLRILSDIKLEKTEITIRSIYDEIISHIDPNNSYISPSGDCDSNFPREGDYDGDGISNWDEVLFYFTDPTKLTVSLSLSNGMNLYYFPSIIDIPNILINTTLDKPDILNDSLPLSQVYYYYDPHLQFWDSSWPILKPNHFNAIHTSDPGLLYLNLIPENRNLILYLNGFFNLDCSITTPYNPADCLSGNLFDPNSLDLIEFPSPVINNPKPTKIQMINGLGSQDGKWEASYLFFEKPAGKDICIKPHDIYVITNI